MKDKYADQDEEEREMKLALLGSKQKVKGFDIDAHSRFVQGSMYVAKKQDSDDEDSSEDDDEDEAEIEEVKDEIIIEEEVQEEEKPEEQNDEVEED